MTSTHLSLLCTVLFAAGCATPGATTGGGSSAATATAAPAVSANGAVTISDPVGDDNGPGTYTYPTDAVYKPGSFDITEFQVVPDGDKVEFRVTVNSRIEDPWDSLAWGGNGFSLQMAFIQIGRASCRERVLASV